MVSRLSQVPLPIPYLTHPYSLSPGSKGVDYIHYTVCPFGFIVYFVLECLLCSVWLISCLYNRRFIVTIFLVVLYPLRWTIYFQQFMPIPSSPHQSPFACSTKKVEEGARIPRMQCGAVCLPLVPIHFPHSRKPQEKNESWAKIPEKVDRGYVMHPNLSPPLLHSQRWCGNAFCRKYCRHTSRRCGYGCSFSIRYRPI